MKYTKDLIQNYQKILILGAPGSGKSTLAKKISDEHNIPLAYYDQIRWQENWTETPKEQIKQKLAELTKQQAYIIEGTYTKKFDPIIEDCDLVIILTVPSVICLSRVLKRTFKSFITGKKGAREDLPSGCNESLGIGYLRFINYTLNYNKLKGSEMIKHLEKHKQKVKII